MQSGYNETDE